jgi:hypothetical protein
MALIVAPKQAKRTIKICLHEVRETEPMTWVPTGRRMYVDRDAPLHSLKGWAQALLTGECTVSATLFDQMVKIVERSYKVEEEETA